jgi:hypothetical protein
MNAPPSEKAGGGGADPFHNTIDRLSSRSTRPIDRDAPAGNAPMTPAFDGWRAKFTRSANDRCSNCSAKSPPARTRLSAWSGTPPYPPHSSRPSEATGSKCASSRPSRRGGRNSVKWRCLKTPRSVARVLGWTNRHFALGCLDHPFGSPSRVFGSPRSPRRAERSST